MTRAGRVDSGKRATGDRFTRRWRRGPGRLLAVGYPGVAAGLIAGAIGNLVLLSLVVAARRRGSL